MAAMSDLVGVQAGGPGLAPDALIHYLAHTEQGHSIREIARTVGCHASTISRQVRRFENRRDDPLIDSLLTRLSPGAPPASPPRPQRKEPAIMRAMSQIEQEITSGTELGADCLRVLRRLAEAGAVLAVAQNMEKAVIVRDLPDGESARTAVVERHLAEVLALKDWITAKSTGRISRYGLTQNGRLALKRMLAETDAAPGQEGFAEARASFAAQPCQMGQGDRTDPSRLKVNLAESPLTALARRRDKAGQPFLGADLVAAGERLREDFELAQMDPAHRPNWEAVLRSAPAAPAQEGAQSDGQAAARARVQRALETLGPGLGDVVLRCCCYLEGMESCERRMGWSARSGKVVLRIALQRLQRHYDETLGKFGPMIG